MSSPREKFVEAMRGWDVTHYYCEDEYYACPKHPESYHECGECTCSYDERLASKKAAIEAFADAECTIVSRIVESDAVHAACRAALLKEVMGD